MRTMIKASAMALTLCCAQASRAAEYDQSKQIFTQAPSPDVSVYPINQLGPVGVSIDLVKPNFTMKLKAIEPASPASKAAGLKPGQFIRTINGVRFTDLDPRIMLGNIITDAEAADGKVTFMVADTPDGEATPVVVQIPVLGAFSPTWPLNCKKSDQIVRNMAEYLKAPGANKGFGDVGMLFLLSTGDPKDTEFVGKWAKSMRLDTSGTWFIGYQGLALCEYYLRTGDKEVLPKIQEMADWAVQWENFGGWGGRSALAHVTYGTGGGHVNAGGTLVLGCVMLAKECGATMPDEFLQRVARHFYRWAGRGNNSYGNNRPEITFVDNGKNGTLAFSMAAAASLVGKGDNSLYAKARDAAAASSFYTTCHMLHGHTGGGIGEVWRSNAMGLLYEKKPNHYRSFMDTRRWHYELARRHDGSFTVPGGGGHYDNQAWGAGYALAFTVPRKTLRLAGAPATEFSKPYTLAERPWGTAADDAFLSLQPAARPDGKPVDISAETVARDAGRHVIHYRINVEGGASDDLLLHYIHHPSFLMRRQAARNIVGFRADYMWDRTGASVRPHLVPGLLDSKDARVRYAMVSALKDAVNNEGVRESCFTAKTFARVMSMINDPEESWYVKDAALLLIGQAPADWIVPHVDTIIPYLKDSEWWLQNAALTALGPVVADERVYKKVLPAIGEFARTCKLFNAMTPFHGGSIPDNLRKASPEVASLAAETLAGAYRDYVDYQSPLPYVVSNVNSMQYDSIVRVMTAVPGGYDALFDVARKKFPDATLPHDQHFLGANPDSFGPELKKAIADITRNKLIYEYMVRNRRILLPQADAQHQDSDVGWLKGLVNLYKKCGIDDYDWHTIEPDLYNATWHYHTFDPPEKQAYDQSPWRYRPVTFPTGMEEWYKPGFDPVKAGWKSGQLPIGQKEGKLVTDEPPCGGGDGACKCKAPMRAFWDKECLLVSGTFKLPKLKEGHLYRIRTGSGMHVGSGDGCRIYINGRQLFERKTGNQPRGGGVPRGAIITKDFIEEFDGGEVIISAITFLRYGNKAIVQMPPVPQGTFSLWIEEMKVPPMDKAMFRKGATLVPMRSSAWQATQDPENPELMAGGDEAMYRYDGKVAANPKLHGSWQAVAQVATMEEFDPAKPVNGHQATIKTVTFNNDGTTDSDALFWSGDMLINIETLEALKMTVETIAGTEYLFVESGNFDGRRGANWKTPLMVMKK